MKTQERALRWLGETWPGNFRIGAVMYDCEDARHVVRQRERTNGHDERIDPALHRFGTLLLTDLSTGNIDAGGARERIARAGVAPFMKIAETRQELVDAIAAMFDLGANVWASGARYAWRDDGVFWEVFWFDPSHGKPNDRR